jgi:NitT/TauT family transport system permease protein
MTKSPKLFGLHAAPSFRFTVLLASIPYILALITYLVAADIRHKDNPNDKLIPTVSQIVSAVDRMAFTEDKRTGNYLMLNDTVSSLKRLGTGVVIAAFIGLMLGLNMAMFPGMQATLFSGVTFISMIPPLAILPILFIVAGIDELAKITLIVIGIFPVISRDIYLAVGKMPHQQITKALTLGATELGVVYRIVLPQIIPRLLDSLRLALGAAWLFLIAAEAIASTDGLGYRIFLVRRYLAMDVIIPYVIWITVLGFTFDWLLRLAVRRFYPWYNQQN